MNIDHGREIVTNSYYEGSLKSSKRELEVSLLSSQQMLLKDLIDCLTVFSKRETNRLNIEIMRDEKERYRIVKRWQAK